MHEYQAHLAHDSSGFFFGFAGQVRVEGLERSIVAVANLCDQSFKIYSSFKYEVCLFSASISRIIINADIGESSLLAPLLLKRREDKFSRELAFSQILFKNRAKCKGIDGEVLI